jgi:hypothetical protein
MGCASCRVPLGMPAAFEMYATGRRRLRARPQGRQCAGALIAVGSAPAWIWRARYPVLRSPAATPFTVRRSARCSSGETVFSSARTRDSRSTWR